jgi:hypothetical protein
MVCSREEKEGRYARLGPLGRRGPSALTLLVIIIIITIIWFSFSSALLLLLLLLLLSVALLLLSRNNLPAVCLMEARAERHKGGALLCVARQLAAAGCTHASHDGQCTLARGAVQLNEGGTSDERTHGHTHKHTEASEPSVGGGQASRQTHRHTHARTTQHKQRAASSKRANEHIATIAMDLAGDDDEETSRQSRTVRSAAVFESQETRFEKPDRTCLCAIR